jgi:hypothetical protein
MGSRFIVFVRHGSIKKEITLGVIDWGVALQRKLSYFPLNIEHRCNSGGESLRKIKMKLVCLKSSSGIAQYYYTNR